MTAIRLREEVNWQQSLASLVDISSKWQQSLASISGEDSRKAANTINLGVQSCSKMAASLTVFDSAIGLKSGSKVVLKRQQSATISGSMNGSTNPKCWGHIALLLLRQQSA